MKPLAAVGLALVLPFLAVSALAGSETPPEGPPWLRDFSEAQTKAIREGKPIFVYLTKTY